MKLFLTFATIVVLFLVGCQCQENYYKESSLKFISNKDSTIEIYDINQNNRLVGNIIAVGYDVNYAFDLHSQQMKFLIKYQSGVSDTLILNYKTEIKYTDKCNYFVELNDVTHSFTNNNPTKKVSVVKNIENKEPLGYTVRFY